MGSHKRLKYRYTLEGAVKGGGWLFCGSKDAESSPKKKRFDSLTLKGGKGKENSLTFSLKKTASPKDARSSPGRKPAASGIGEGKVSLFLPLPAKGGRQREKGPLRTRDGKGERKGALPVSRRTFHERKEHPLSRIFKKKKTSPNVDESTSLQVYCRQRNEC